ncbi:UNVERIFIED_CONTAM: protein NRT1/ PTR FAMILY 8.1 [Sesamum angustifolium]|uniref:Protein NRT1/ PTR FAMILY 8.1 n=1 Tax=Sesamum angustifolium TaxID=2727405 RepID=A0AAW2L7W8_9LAMI
MHRNTSRRTQILRQSPSRLGINHCSRNLFRSAVHVLHPTGQHHGQKNRPAFRNPVGLHCCFYCLKRPDFSSHLREARRAVSSCQNRPSAGITSLQRMGIGLFVSIFAMVPAALVEKKRRDHPSDRLSIFWLFPQFFLVGTAEVFTYVGQLEFFYDEATDGMRSINSAIFLSEIGIGSWLSTAIVKIVERATGGLQEGWLRNDLNASRLDYFYWILTGINAVNFLVYLWVAQRYKGRNGGGRSVRDESVVEELTRNKENADDKGEFRSQCSPIWWKGRSS